ncbi:penicillin-binding protein [Acidiferrimicrobium sp. IK]|uniref:transglycosylase domain-containing protein n=1 Tax=Acidiferrimicrobium sp. IK TaxID=2871700 RepID=UPI0021CB3D7D|nr:transglycosylase domain-containing protein [Acidiferrimicrobium sp. IK]MCU4186229.1 penicillin-binding protein [Acidiferrimicrobium sp. IK]
MRLLRRIIRIVFSSLFLAGVTVVGVPVTVVATVLAGLILLPLPATIPIPATKALAEPTVVYDRNGGVIATFQQYDQNLPVTEAEIPPILKEAVISDEDRNFYHHGGVDLRGTLRALVADIRNQRAVQGGSTITQQYVKLAYVGAQRNIVRKVREAILASQLDRQASKDEILYRYLTLVYFGDGNYGVGAAAEDYFHVPVSQLDASQAATLAGLIPAPSSRAPTTDIAAAEKYRQLVLGKMLQQGYLSQDQYGTAMGEHLAGAPANGAAPPAGATVVYTPTPPPSKYPVFVDYVQRWLLADGYTLKQIYSDGLRIQTTLDPKLEDDAVASVGYTLAGTAPNVDMALASVEPQTGFVEALVGGRNFGVAGSKYRLDNLAISACDNTPLISAAAKAGANPTAACWDGNSVDNAGSPGHQPGSSWKPFVLAAAFEQGIQPTAAYSAPVILQIPGCVVAPGHPASDCQVHNDVDGEGGGTLTLAAAMAASVNTVYAQLAPQVGCVNVAKTAKALGVDSAYFSSAEFPHCETYALGEQDVAPLDMASAYGVFDDHGQRAAPTPILEIVDANGKVLLNNIAHPPKTTTVMPANVADNVTNVLQGVLLPGGTAYGHGLGRPAAGKTGTTSNESNAWFTGYTPTLSTSVWMGRDDNPNAGLGTVKGVNPVVGGTWPAATWQSFMNQALAGVPVTPFNQPAPIVTPTAAGALGPTGSAPKPKVQPGAPSYPPRTPTGGPYVLDPSAPVAVAPANPAPIPGAGSPTTTTTTVPSQPGPTTTVPGATTTTTVPGVLGLGAPP